METPRSGEKISPRYSEKIGLISTPISTPTSAPISAPISSRVEEIPKLIT